MKRQKSFRGWQLIPSGEHHRLQVLGEAICSSEAVNLRLRTMCFLTTLLPAGKATEEANLMALSAKLSLSIPSGVFQGCRAPGTSQKLRNGLPGSAQRDIRVSHRMLTSCLPHTHTGDLSLGPERRSGTGLSSLRGEGEIVTRTGRKEAETRIAAFEVCKPQNKLRSMKSQNKTETFC